MTFQARETNLQRALGAKPMYSYVADAAQTPLMAGFLGSLRFPVRDPLSKHRTAGPVPRSAVLNLSAGHDIDLPKGYC